MGQIPKIVVTGGSGFIGTHLCKALSQSKYAVINIDRVKPTWDFPGVASIRTDVRDTPVLNEHLQGADVVFHLAALASVPLCEEAPEESDSINVGGTKVLIDTALRFASPSVRFVFASSSAIYGNPEVQNPAGPLPLLEAKQPASPQSRYARQKWESEEHLRKAARDHQMKTLVFRFFNVYGPGQNPDSPYSGVLSIFKKRLQNAQPLDLFGGGKQTRDFISVHDIVNGCLKGISLAPDNPAWKGDPVNLGTQTSTSIRELATLMSRLTNRPVDFRMAPPRTADVHHSLADNQRAKQWLDWAPKVQLSEGLRELLAD